MADKKEKVWDAFQDSVNMSAGELEAWKGSEQFEAYADAKSGGQPPTEPIDDAIRLLETPKSEWEDTNDGFNEVEQAEELVNFNARMSANDSGDPIPGTDPPLSKRDASLISWARDPNPEREDFEGDRR